MIARSRDQRVSGIGKCDRLRPKTQNLAGAARGSGTSPEQKMRTVNEGIAAYRLAHPSLPSDDLPSESRILDILGFLFGPANSN